MTISFPAAQPASESNDDMIHEYWITLTKEDGSSFVRKIYSDYYRKDQNQMDTWIVNLNNLKPNSYTVSVQAVTSFDVASEPITTAKAVAISRK